MRFSTNLMFSQRVTDMNNVTARWMEAGSKLASGQRVSKPSDDPQASAQAVRVSLKIVTSSMHPPAAMQKQG